MRIMPANGQDVSAARRIVELAYPTVAPVLGDMMKWMRVADSPVADVFAAFFAKLGDPSLAVIAEGLRKDNCWLRHQILTIVLPNWSDSAVGRLRDVLSMIATHPDAYDNDIRSVAVLVKLQLVDRGWLRDWVRFKRERWQVRDGLLKEVEKELESYSERSFTGPNNNE